MAGPDEGAFFNKELKKMELPAALVEYLARAAAGVPGCVVKANGPLGGLALYEPGNATPLVLYEGRV